MSPRSNFKMQNSQIYVAIDVETTGLNSSTDELIDIGAVKFNENGTIETYSSLIKPKQLISKFITQLTKISNHDVINAPQFEDVKEEFIRFLGDFPIIGHNVSFDVGFLKSNGIPITQPLIDTYQLAAYLLPKDTYSLANLARVFKIGSWNMHRALPDAETTKTLFIKLIEHAMEFDPDLISQLQKFSKNSQDPLEMVFETISIAQSKKQIYGKLGSLGYNRQNLEKRTKANKSSTQEFSNKITNLLLNNVFSPEGPLSKIIDNFEYRNEQEEIAYSVWKCLNENKNLLLEGGTGIGKTLSYLIPSTLFSIENNSKVVISTNTINLQEQLLHKDIPSMKKVIVESTGIPSEYIEIINLKGRNNYLCLDKWETQQSFPELSNNQARVFGKINTWLNTTDTGDKSEINIERRDREIWDSISSENCHECQKRSTFCFLRSLREKSEDSQIVITNHSLLLRDMVQGGGLLPEYKYLIVDEAHHLENEATSQFSNFFSSDKIENLLNSVNGDRGLINIKSSLKLPSQNSQQYMEKLSETAGKLDHLVTMIRFENQNLFTKTENLFSGTIKKDIYDQNNHLLFSEINNETWSSIVETWKLLEDFINELENLVLEYKKLLNTIEKLSTSETKFLFQSPFTIIENTINLVQQAGLHFFLEDDKNTIYWINQHLDEFPTYNSAPLNVGEILKSKLEDKNSVILTSGTLAIREDFSAIEKQVGLNDSDKLIIKSPFNYAESVLMCLPTNMPSPTERNYTEKLSETIGEIAKLLKGHTLVLFTSHKSLRDSWKYLTEYLEGSDIQVIAQGINGPPNRIMNSFIENNESVILGASSFWEGVDFPKQSLNAIIIARLPFEPPNDPIFRARSQLFDNPFMEYALPNAVIRFRQGFGRLIRRATDKGVFIILDSRISKNKYGRNFIEALPKFIHKNVSTNEMPTIINDWLQKDE